MEMALTAWLGIDIAKQKFDVALNWKTRHRAKVFRNDAEGWESMSKYGRSGVAHSVGGG